MSLFAEASAANPTLAALWSRARADYIGGCTAAEACRRYGLSKSRFFERARDEGWRRKDEPPADRWLDDEPVDEGAEISTEGPLQSARALAELAWRRAERALASGDLRASQGWTNLALTYRRTAANELGVGSWKRVMELSEAPPPAQPPVNPAADFDMSTLPPAVLDDADAFVHYVGELMRWPELAAKGRPLPQPEPPPPAPDSPDFFVPPDPDVEADDEPDLPPLSPEELAEWRSWAAVSERLRGERPDEPWWGEALDVDAERDAPAVPLPESPPG